MRYTDRQITSTSENRDLFAQTMGRKNLTVKFLMEHSDFSRAAGTLDKPRRNTSSTAGVQLGDQHSRARP
jgi:hypothetical protein